MDGSQVLGVGLATLVQALNSRKLGLLEQLRQVERDLEAVNHTLQAADRLGFPTAPDHVEPAPAVASSTQRANDGPHGGTVSPSRGRNGCTDDFLVRKAALASVGSAWDDGARPPKVDALRRRHETSELPKEPAGLAALHGSVRRVAERAAKLPPGPGGKRYASTRGLVPGEPVAPTLRRILRSADRPLSTNEVTAAFLQVRNLAFEGDRFAALQARVSSLLSTDATSGRVRRIHQDGTRAVLWQHRA